ncbi:MAG: hypothetical protein ACTSWW_08885 [Promethearchaeota archaeon]
MKSHRKATIFLFGIMLMSFSLSSISQSPVTYTDLSAPLASADIITSDNVTLYVDGVEQAGIPELKRGLDTVNITFIEDVPLSYVSFIANITFADSVSFNLTLEENYPFQWSAEFLPSITNTTGTADIRIFALDGASDVFQNEDVEFDAQISVVNNLPTIAVLMNTTRVNRNNSVALTIVPSDIENNVDILEWEVTLYKPGDAEQEYPLVVKGEKIFEYDLEILNDYPAGDWEINATCWDNETEDNFQSKYFDLIIVDNSPVIEEIYYGIEEADVSNATISIYRGQTLNVKLNLTDIDTNETLLRMNIYGFDPITGANIFFPEEYHNLEPFIHNWTFEKNISFPYSLGLGVMNLNLTIFDSTDAQVFTSVIRDITVLNNAPEIESFLLNGLGSNGSDQISIVQGEWLHFMFQVSDPENSIDLVRILLVYENEYTGKDEFFNYTMAYDGSDTTISIRAVDLPVGTFVAYAYVIDKDGAMTGMISPYSFDIVAEKSDQSSMWLMLVVGMILGGLVGLVMTSLRYRRKEEKQLISSEEPVKSPRRSKKNKEKLTESDTPVKEEKKEEPKPKKKKKLVRKL